MPRPIRNQTVPAAEAAVLVGENTARAEGAEALGQGGGRGLELSHAGVAVSQLRPRNTSSAAGWRRSRRVSRGAASRSWIPASSGMEVSCG